MQALAQPLHHLGAAGGAQPLSQLVVVAEQAGVLVAEGEAVPGTVTLWPQEERGLLDLAGM